LPAQTTSEKALSHARAQQERFLRELAEFVRFPSVSGDPARARDVARCAQWLCAQLKRGGLANARLIETAGHPIVTARWAGAPGRPTVLIYGHYDVQPADPLSEWRTHPFAPTLVGDDLFGRGVSDDKGQMFVHVKALESLLMTEGRLPVNIVCVFEGEEEIGSPHLSGFMARTVRETVPDVALMSDTRMLGPGRPTLTYGLRGMLSMELEVRGAPHDLHSGGFGGAVRDPLDELCALIASLHDHDGRVAIPRFYDRVRTPGPSARAEMARSGPTAAEILRHAGVAHGWGERGFTTYERTTIRPDVSVNGLAGGYQGQGGKAIIPARARAKLGFRLVPEQDPREVEQLACDHFARTAPRSVTLVIRKGSAAWPVRIDRRHPALRAAAQAYREGFGAAPAFVLSGGTIPVVASLQSLGVPTVLMGFALPDDRMHAPNEKFHVPNFRAGIATSLAFLGRLGAWRRRMAMSAGPRLEFARRDY
jgi:acetylornithine deacetylase/succinyl-diaminopimelate desuccinylase-like protein